MSWLSKLYKTYESGANLDLSDDQKLMPISHTLQNAHINIVVDGDGNFKRASVLEKTKIVLPATESSAGRSSGEAPHPLADKIQYVAKDYPEYGGRKKTYFASYEKLLSKWCHSSHKHPKAMAVYNYITKGSLVGDLIDAKVLHVDKNNVFLPSWPVETDIDNPSPLIFKVLPALPKNKRTNPDALEVEPGDALVCWSVEGDGQVDSSTWNDTTLQQSWIDFDAATSGEPTLCFVTGQDKPIAVNHPAKLRHTGDKAKLISSNDSSGFTFRGKFTDKDGSQAVGISFEVTQKAHNALRWLIARQGYRNGDQVYVAWAVSGKPIPPPLEDTWTLLGKPIILKPFEKEGGKEKKVDHGKDLGQSFAYQFNKYLAGYRSNFELNDQIIVMGIDSATPGRMGIIYYRELLASEFFDRIGSWHTQFAWPQRHTIEVPSLKKGKKTFNKTIWPISAPVPKIISDAAYGKILKTNDTLKKNLHERIMPCIIDGRSFPRDIMERAVRRACNRANHEHREWERNLGVACALYRGFHLRQPETKRRIYAMALEEDNRSRDYLYGRLLAIAERIEEVALTVGGENRPTAAARLMQRFADRPSTTWRNIELGLQPYMQRLQSSRPGFLTNRKKELDVVTASFQHGDFSVDKSLSGEFLLGYHCQRMTYRSSQSDTTKED